MTATRPVYQLGESGRDAASGEQGLIDPVDEAEGTDRPLGQTPRCFAAT